MSRQHIGGPCRCISDSGSSAANYFNVWSFLCLCMWYLYTNFFLSHIARCLDTANSAMLFWNNESIENFKRLKESWLYYLVRLTKLKHEIKPHITGKLIKHTAVISSLCKWHRKLFPNPKTGLFEVFREHSYTFRELISDNK